jgi:hypothetical protein
MLLGAYRAAVFRVNVMKYHIEMDIKAMTLMIARSENNFISM